MARTTRLRRTSSASVAALVLAVVLALVASACSDDESSGEVTTTQPSGGLSVSTPEGEVSLSLDGDLPPGWPSDFPLPDRTDPAGSGSLANESSGVMVGVFTTKESGSDAFDFYTEESSLDPSGAQSAGAGSGFLGSVDIGGEYDGSVTVAGLDDTNYIVVVLNGDGTGSSSTTTEPS